MKYKYKIKEYSFYDHTHRVWYKAFYKRFLFWHSIKWCWAHMNWTDWCQTKKDAEQLIKSHISDHTKSKYKVTNEYALDYNME